MNSNPNAFPFSNKFRQERSHAAQQTEYDIIVIGGGITGAGIAFDATQRGLRTLLLEKNDFASGTSSKSTKLIHGGLRYLKQLEFGLVKETGLERAIAHRNICHLVHPEEMLLPIVKNGSFNTFTASIAIGVYDALAKVPKEQRRKRLSKAETLDKVPILNQELLKGGIAYAEYRTDDARLTIELIKSARGEYGEAFNYAEVKDFVYTNEKITGVKCYDIILDKEITFKSKLVISATGPWADHLRQNDDSTSTKNLHLSKGVHIVISKEKLPLTTSTYFDVFDGRMLFAIPRGKVVYVGTTDDTFKGDLDNLECTIDDAQYLLQATNLMFDTVELTLDDIESTWVGLRPLIQQEGKSAKELSRRDEIFVSKSGLISIAGGKLTGYRKMAKRVVDLALKRDPTLPKTRSNTRKNFIHAQYFDNYQAFLNYQEELQVTYPDISAYNIWYLTTTFGKAATHIIAQALEDTSDSPINKKLITSQIQFALDHESIYDPQDFFIRRTGMMYFDINSVKANSEAGSKMIADHLGICDKLAKQLTALNASIKLHSLDNIKGI